MRKVLYVSLVVALAACMNFVLADEKGSPVKRALGKLFSSSPEEAKDAERELLSDSSPETQKALQKQIELGCKEGNYKKVQRLAKMKEKMLSNSGVKAKVLKPGKKRAKPFVISKPSKEDKLGKPQLVGKKIPVKVKKEKGGAR